MSIDAKLVKTLREKTGAGMMDCKKALVDSNTDPTLCTHPIPANDDSIRTIQLLVTEIANAIIEVAQKNAKAEEAEKQSEAKKEV